MLYCKNFHNTYLRSDTLANMYLIVHQMISFKVGTFISNLIFPKTQNTPKQVLIEPPQNFNAFQTVINYFKRDQFSLHMLLSALNTVIQAIMTVATYVLQAIFHHTALGCL